MGINRWFSKEEGYGLKLTNRAGLLDNENSITDEFYFKNRRKIMTSALAFPFFRALKAPAKPERSSSDISKPKGF